MRFVELKVTKKQIVYINPDKVLSVTPYGDDKCMIRLLDGYSVAVLHSAEEVVKELSKSDDLEY